MAVLRGFAINDPVDVLNHGLGAKWLPGVVLSKEGTRVFLCRAERWANSEETCGSDQAALS